MTMVNGWTLRSPAGELGRVAGRLAPACAGVVWPDWLGVFLSPCRTILTVDMERCERKGRRKG